MFLFSWTAWYLRKWPEKRQQRTYSVSQRFANIIWLVSELRERLWNLLSLRCFVFQHFSKAQQKTPAMLEMKKKHMAASEHKKDSGSLVRIKATRNHCLGAVRLRYVDIYRLKTHAFKKKWKSPPCPITNS